MSESSYRGYKYKNIILYIDIFQGIDINLKDVKKSPSDSDSTHSNLKIQTENYNM